MIRITAKIWLLLLHLVSSHSVETVIEPKFRIKYDLNQFQSNSSYEVLTIANEDTNLRCLMPNLTDPSVVSKMNGQGDVMIQKTPAELISEVVPQLSNFMDTKNCMFISGLNERYWTYGYCFGDKIIQFHENEAVFRTYGLHKPEFPAFVYVLGRFEGSDSAEAEIEMQSTEDSRRLRLEDFEVVDDPIKSNSDLQVQPKALKHVLKDGEVCDLTEEPRTIEVYYRCDPHSNVRTDIVYVNEIRTCKYRMIVNLKGLCGIEEFAPVSDEKVMNIVCVEGNKDEEGGDTERGEEKEGEEGAKEEGESPFFFPQPRQKRVNLDDFNLTPGGDGFFWGTPKSDSSDVYDTRSVVFFTEEITESFAFVKRFSRMFSNSMESKILSPDPSSPNELVTWDDSFIVWYEVYNHFGVFEKVVKVKRQGNKVNKATDLQLVDPFEMVDQDGDTVVVPQPSENRRIYQYEVFGSRPTPEMIQEMIEEGVLSDEYWMDLEEQEERLQREEQQREEQQKDPKEEPSEPSEELENPSEDTIVITVTKTETVAE